MEFTNEKCVLVIDPDLPVGVIANTAAICGITLGKCLPETVGPDVYDRSGSVHPGIIEFPVPVLKADRDGLRSIRDRLRTPRFAEIVAVDFSNLAQSCRSYGEFIRKAAGAEESTLTYLGLGLCGPKKLVEKLTGSLPLLR